MLNMDLFTLYKLDEELTREDVSSLKFLCQDLLPKKCQETIEDAKHLFQYLKEQDQLSKQLISSLLYIIGRRDLLRVLGVTTERLMENQEDPESAVSPYRKMLYRLSKDVTNETLNSIKFLLEDMPKAKLQSATFLDILVEMEKMDKLGKDNLDELESILNACAKDVACKIQKFKNNRTTEPGEPTCSSYPCQESKRGSCTLSTEETYPLSLSMSQTLSLNTDSNGPSNTTETEFYPMTQRPLGYCLIINNFNFEQMTTFGNRKGTDKDKDALLNAFSKMHFIVEERKDLTQTNMQEVLKEFAGKDHSQMHAFVCCILSHGQRGTVLGIDGYTLPIHEITEIFGHVNTLTGKPKLFFIQACQGSNFQEAVGTNVETKEDDAYDPDISGVSLHADMLIGLATVESCKSFRHTIDGSIYIQELCKQLEIDCPKKEDILSILTKVNAKVSSGVFLGHKQMPQPRYTLTKKLVLPMD